MRRDDKWITQDGDSLVFPVGTVIYSGPVDDIETAREYARQFVDDNNLGKQNLKITQKETEICVRTITEIRI